MHHRSFLLAASLIAFRTVLCHADVPIINPSFEQGDTEPIGWALNRGEGGLVSPAPDGRRAIAVTGDGNTDNAWFSDPVTMAPDTVYRLQFQAKRLQGAGGTTVTGPLFCNRDLRDLDDAWSSYDSYFVTPHADDMQQHPFRFGQWKLAGQVAFDNIRLTPAIPVHRRVGEVELGTGETIRNGRYSFQAPFGLASANHSRPLAWHHCQFNSNRWVLSSPETDIVYRHHIGPRQSQVSINVSVGWHQRGELVVEVRGKQSEWQIVGTLGEVGSAAFEVPSNLLPAEELWVRFSARKQEGESAGPALQLYTYRYEAQLDKETPDMVGATHYVAITQEDPDLSMQISDLGDTIPGGKNTIDMRLKNNSLRTLKVDLCSETFMINRSAPDSAPFSSSHADTHELAPGATSDVISLRYELGGAGPHRLRISSRGDARIRAETSIDVPALHASNYGRTLPGSTNALGLWWCSSGWKISAQRPVPLETSNAITVSAAANETEAVQLVLRPRHTIDHLAVKANDLLGPDNQRLPATAIEVRRVGYVHVAQPTDSTGTVGPWPDPLPPLQENETVGADRNFPLWICVHVPKGQKPGIYRGQISLGGSNIAAEIPLRVEVFDFTLPDRMSCKTAFGLDTSVIWKYHGLTTEAQKREVLEKYMRCLSANHISPYQPAPLDSIQVSWKNLPVWGGGKHDRVNPHGGRQALQLKDESEHANASIAYQKQLPVSKDGFTLRFWHRAKQANHAFIITLQHYDQNGQWMSGRNTDLRVSSSLEWQPYEKTISSFPEGTASVRLHLRATVWSDEGMHTGTVWFDDVALIDLNDGSNLITNGGFESDEQPTPYPEFDFRQWDRAMHHAIDQLHFNTFRLSVPGLGGGTFHARYAPSLLGYTEDTPQYQAAMEDYLGQLQEHLRAKGWLDEAFVYWFDEPAPKDYEFVNNGFAKLKRWAPEIPRMLTEQVEPELVGGPTIWCPVTSSYDHEDAEQRRAAGEAFWWYVCTGPKAPYCTLFIDHPATEMRVWLWQSWQRDMKGILVWQTNYWSSTAAYPNQPQNPYEDPMGWVSGYSTSRGTRRAWGNGDGRFIYPPVAAADGRPTRPVLDAPVSSIRLEMLRDGIEDYEYLEMLRKRLGKMASKLTAEQRHRAEQLLAVPPEITSDMTSFTTDPRPIDARRRAIGRAIEMLGGIEDR